jgi:hypothetical protein
MQPRIPILLGLACGIALALHGNVTVWTDSFDGIIDQRTVNGSGQVNSFEWYSAGGAYSYSGGRLVTASDRGALGYFTAPGASAVLTNPGDSITVHINFVYDRAGSNTGDRFRIGLYQSVANPDAITGTGFEPNGPPNTLARTAANYDNNSSTVNSHFINLYTGLSVNRLTAKSSAGDVAADNVSFFERIGGATANSVIGPQAGMAGTDGFNLIGTGGNAFTIGPGWFTSDPPSQVPLDLTFSITLKGIDTGSGKSIIDLEYMLTDGIVTNSFAVLDYMTDVPLSFDTLALYARSAYPNLNEVTITLVPEPSLYALLAGVLGIGLVLRRRRR